VTAGLRLKGIHGKTRTESKTKTKSKAHRMRRIERIKGQRLPCESAMTTRSVEI